MSFFLGTGSGKLEYAALFLKQADDPTPFLWNSVIRGYEQSQKPWRAIHVYYQMLHNLVCPDKFSFPFVLKACASVQAIKEGERIHCRIIKYPLNMDFYVQGSLIFMYVKCGDIDAARASFDAMPYKNLICWNTMTDGYVKNGDIYAAHELFDLMPERDLFSWNVMVDGYAKCGQLESARRLFHEMPERDIVSWNSIIGGYAKCRNMTAARNLFDIAPLRDVVTWGIMINGFAECGQIEIAHNWFEKVPYKNLINWNCLINGYAKSGDVTTSHKLFESMPLRNLTSWNIMLDCCIKHGERELASQIFWTMPIKDVVSWNIMVDGYARIGRMDVAGKLFHSMPFRDIVSWNVIIAGYRQSGQPREAFDMYVKMHLLGEKPDNCTLSTVLSAIADLGLFVQGRWIHAYLDRNKVPLDGIVGVALIDMYAKCGYVEIALRIFKTIPRKSKDHWNAIISGLAVHGYGSLALSLFEAMEQSLVLPDDVTFIALLNACSHAGLVSEGHLYFELMEPKYGIAPKIQHYGCMVDLLSRAGRLEAAVVLVSNMPVRANDVVWRALLGASRNLGDIDIAECAARHLIELAPHDSSSYVLLSNIYRWRGLYKHARHMWRTMKERGVSKIPGCSSIELQGILHEFIVGDTSHPEMTRICVLLNSLTQALMLAGYVPDMNLSLFDTACPGN